MTETNYADDKASKDAPEPPRAAPNIIFILADDLGWTDVSTGRTNAGNPSDYYRTPNIDRLAEQGVSFTSCYAQPNCAPTRAAILSGQYAPRSGNGVYNVADLNRGTGEPPLVGPAQNQDVPASTYTVAEMLRDAGYVTAHVGKYHVGGHEGGESTLPESQGFDVNIGGTASGSPATYFANKQNEFHKPSIGPGLDVFGRPYRPGYIEDAIAPLATDNDPSVLDGTSKHVTDAEGDAVIEFLTKHVDGPDADRPFFLQYHPYAVHTPIEPRPDLETMYVNREEGARHRNEKYAGLVEGLDQNVGRILRFLEEKGLADNTLIVLTSDNGGVEKEVKTRSGKQPITENKPLRSEKGSFYEGGIRVPLIVRYPGVVPPGEISDSMVHSVDFYPTLMDAAAGSPQGPLDGISFFRHASDPTISQRLRDPIFYHFPGYLDYRARPCSVVIKEVDGERYKLIYNYDFTYDPRPDDDGIKVLEQPWELYNLTNDLSEESNLIENPGLTAPAVRAIAKNLAVDLHAWLTQEAPDWKPTYPSTREGDTLSAPVFE